MLRRPGKYINKRGHVAAEALDIQPGTCCGLLHLLGSCLLPVRHERTCVYPVSALTGMQPQCGFAVCLLDFKFGGSGRHPKQVVVLRVFHHSGDLIFCERLKAVGKYASTLIWPTSG